jgi:hypothetical protein
MGGFIDAQYVNLSLSINQFNDVFLLREIPIALITVE